MQQERPVGCQRHSRSNAQRALKGRVAARILSRVEIGEAIQVCIVGRAIVQKVSNAEINAAAAREQLIGDAVLRGVRIRRRSGEIARQKPR